MNLIELQRRNGDRYLFDFDSQWEIDDKGENPALWSNHDQGRNLDCKQTYEEIRKAVYGQMMPSTVKSDAF